MGWSKAASQAEQPNTDGMNDADYAWKIWSEVESCRRTGYCIWVSLVAPTRECSSRVYAVARLYVGFSLPNAPSLVT
jgi:hypothetical protein